MNEIPLLTEEQKETAKHIKKSEDISELIDKFMRLRLPQKKELK